MRPSPTALSITKLCESPDEDEDREHFGESIGVVLFEEEGRPEWNEIAINTEIDGDFKEEQALALDVSRLRGCGMLGSGASRGVGSIVALDEVQKDRILHGDSETQGTVVKRSFRVADGARSISHVEGNLHG